MNNKLTNSVAARRRVRGRASVETVLLIGAISTMGVIAFTALGESKELLITDRTLSAADDHARIEVGGAQHAGLIRVVEEVVDLGRRVGPSPRVRPPSTVGDIDPMVAALGQFDEAISAVEFSTLKGSDSFTLFNSLRRTRLSDEARDFLTQTLRAGFSDAEKGLRVREQTWSTSSYSQQYSSDHPSRFPLPGRGRLVTGTSTRTFTQTFSRPKTARAFMTEVLPRVVVGDAEGAVAKLREIETQHPLWVGGDTKPYQESLTRFEAASDRAFRRLETAVEVASTRFRRNDVLPPIKDDALDGDLLARAESNQLWDIPEAYVSLLQSVHKVLPAPATGYPAATVRELVQSAAQRAALGRVDETRGFGELLRQASASTDDANLIADELESFALRFAASRSTRP